MKSSLLENIDTCLSNPENSSTTKKSKYTSSVYALFTHYSFEPTKNKYDCYRGEDCMKHFSNVSKKHAKK